MLPDIAKQGSQIIERRPRPWPSEWVYENGWLSSVNAGTDRDVRADIWYYPANVGILDMAVEPKRGILVKKAAQVGVSQLFQWLLGYEIATEGGPVGYSMAKDDTVREHVLDRILTMIEKSPDLQKLYLPGGKAAHQTIYSHRFVNATLKFFGASSVNNFKSNPYRAAFADEFELMGTFPDGSDAVQLLLGRQGAFGFPKMYGFSTPAEKNAGISQYVELDSDRRFFYIRCTRCKQPTDLDFWRDVHFEYQGGDPIADSAALLCPNCREEITDTERAHALIKAAQAACPWYKDEPYDENVGWLSTLDPAEASRRQFAGVEKYPKLLNPHKPVRELSSTYVLARRSEAKTKTFVNDDLGKEYTIYAQVLTEEDILAKKATGEIAHIPNETLWITCGSDVQGGANVADELIFYFDISAWIPTQAGVLKKTITIDRIQGKKSNGFKIPIDYFRSWTAHDDTGNVYKISTLVIDAGWRTGDVFQICAALNGNGTAEWAVPMIFSKKQSAAERQKQLARGSDDSKLDTGASYQWSPQDVAKGGDPKRHVVLADRNYVVDRCMDRFNSDGRVELPPATPEEVVQHYLANEQIESYDRHGNYQGLHWQRRQRRGGWKEPDDWMLAGSYCEMAAVFRGLDEQEGRAIEIAQKQAEEVAQRRNANRDERRRERISRNRQKWRRQR